jgi:hypothetical protein
MRRITPALIATLLLVLGTPAAAFATHNGYKYAAPKLSSLAVVSCTQVRVTWQPSATSGGGFTSINYGLRSDFRSSLQWNPWEYGTRAQVNGATTTVVSHLRPGARQYFRVYAGEYGGHRQSKYSNVRSVVTPAC